METSSSERPTLSKTRTNSSLRRPSRTTSSKYGSITEERNRLPNDMDDSSSEEFHDTQTGGEVFEIPEEEEEGQTRSADRTSVNSLDYELTLKDKQEVLCTT